MFNNPLHLIVLISIHCKHIGCQPVASQFRGQTYGIKC